MRDDVGVVEVGGQQERDRDGPPAVLAVLLAGHRDRADIGEVARHDVGDGGREDGVTVQVEELDGPGDTDRGRKELGADRAPCDEPLVEPTATGTT